LPLLLAIAPCGLLFAQGGTALPGAPAVDYTIAARLDDAAALIHGRETIRYRNLTSDTLGSLWLHLYANAFRDRSTVYGRELEAMGSFDFSLARKRDRGWIAVDLVQSGGRVALVSESETELGLFLDPPLVPSESITFSVSFSTKVPSSPGELSRRGRSFILAHWFLEVAAHTRSAGWLTAGYHVFGHSPAAFADYHVTLDLAADLTVAATGSITDSQSPVDRPGRRIVQIEAKNVSGLAVAAAPGLKKMARSIGGVEVTILARSFANSDWYYALMSGADMIQRMQEWNGPFPFPSLTVVDGSGIVAQDASYPGLIVMATRSIPFTRTFEQALARQVALQWSAGATGADELSDPGVAQGPAVYSEIRYLDTKYGRTSLVANPVFGWLLKGLNDEYLQRLYYYLGASNHVLCTDPAECRDQAGYQAAEQSGPALLLLAEERKLGRPVFDSLMRNWMQSRAELGTVPSQGPAEARSPNSDSMPNGGDLRPQIETFELDSSLGLRHSRFARQSDSILPTRLGDHRVTVRPLFALPSFTDYQIFYGPYAWADNYHGFELCAWAQGRQLYDAGPLRGRHQWTASEIYSTRLRDWHSSVNYQTPLTFINDRLRVYAALDYSQVDAGAKLYFSQELGPVFRQPKTTIDFGYRILDVKNDTFRDPRAWQLARTADIRFRLAQSYESRLVLGSAQALVRKGVPALGSRYDYLRVGLEQSHTWRGLRPFNLTARMFAGYVWGNVPSQDQFYLSGGLTSNAAEPVSWGYEGWTSGQEHWHYDADVNCRGYAGEYLHGRAAYGLNLEANLVKLGLISLCPFFDLGNVGDPRENRDATVVADVGDTSATRSSRRPVDVSPSGSTPDSPDFWQPRLDAGVRLKLGPLYADFPFWRSQVGAGESQFAFRWMLGLKLSGTLGSS